MLKYKIYHKNGKTKIINAKDLKDAEVKTNKIWKEWEDIKLLKYTKFDRKSPTLNKRQYVKQSDKIYDRNKAKKQFKDEIKKEGV